MLVLTYHSISNAGGPTSIPPAVFAMQMQVLADLGRKSLRLDEFIAWHEGTMASLSPSMMRSRISRSSPLRFSSGMASPRSYSFPRGGWAARKPGKAPMIPRGR